MVDAERIRIEKAYGDLLAQINERQVFEKNNPRPPYSNHPTTLSYFDAQGYTLLQYAAALGDMQKVQECLGRGADVNAISVKWMESPEESPEETPIAMALRNGHVEVAEYLFNQGANCAGLHPEICQDQKTRDWLERKIKSALSGGESKELFESDAHSALELLKRAAEIGDVGFIENNFRYIKNSDKQEALNQSLVVAARNGKLDVVNYLLENGAQVNQKRSYAISALNQAAKFGHVEVVDRLMVAEAHTTRVDERKCSALMRAIDSGSFETVARINRDEIYLDASDVNGENVMHYCARCTDPKIIEELAAISRTQALMGAKNIYGQTPMDVAVSKKNDQFISVMNPAQNLSEIKASAAYGHELPVIGHHVLITRWQHYFNAQYRDKDMFSFVGKCNGFSYLHEYYSARNMEPYFFQTLALISEWDGSQKALDTPFAEGSEQKKYYKNLGELFEQWINDVIYLQHSDLGQVSLETTQSDREEHMILVGSDEDYAHVSFFRLHGVRTHLKEPAQAQELLSYASRMPANTRFEIRSSNHDTSGHVDVNQKLDHYDPNYAYQTSKMDKPDELSTRVMDYQYIWTDCLHDKNDLMEFDFEVFCFSGERDSLQLNQYHVFSESELPRSSVDAEEFRHQSPNRFTPLHVAVMTHCTQDLARLLKDGFCYLNAKDIYGRTAMKMARENANDEAVMMICYALPSKQKAEQLVSFANEKSTPFVVNLINNGVDFLIKFDDAGRDTTALQEIVRASPEYSPLLISKMADINTKDELGNTPLFYAVKYQRLDLVKDLLEKGADVNLECENRETIVDLLQTAYTFDPQLRMQAYQLVLPTLKFETESLKQTLSKMLFSWVERGENELSNLLLNKCDQSVLNISHDNGLNVLHMALFKHNVAMSKQLMAAGVNVNAQSGAGNTALMAILILGSARVKEPRLTAKDVHELVKECISHNPDLSLENKKGETAATLIKELYPHDAQLAMMVNCHDKKPKDSDQPHLDDASTKPKLR